MMRKWLACALIVVGCSVAGAQNFDRKFDVEIPAGPAVKVFDQLSKAAGIRLEPAPNLRNEVFVIRVHDVTVREVMEKIAKAEGGDWVRQGENNYYLTRSQGATQAQERAELQARTERIAEALAKLREKANLEKKFDDDTATKLAQGIKNSLDDRKVGSADYVTLQAATPGARAIARLLTDIGPAQLAKIGRHRRVVFSTRPTRMQLAIGGNGFSDFLGFAREQKIYRDADRTANPQPEGGVAFAIGGWSDGADQKGDLRLGLGLGLVVVRRDADDSLQVELLAADPNLDTLAATDYNLDLPAPKSAKPEGKQSKPLEISDDAKEMAKALGGSGAEAGGGTIQLATASFTISATSNDSGVPAVIGFSSSDDGAKVKLSPRLREKVLHPEDFDPLSFVPGEAMLALGRQTDHNIVALLPDPCFHDLTARFARPVTAPDLIAEMPSRYGLAIDASDDWYVVSPLAPAQARDLTVDRPALGKLLRALDRSKLLRLDDIAAFAVAQAKVPGFDDIDGDYVGMIDYAALGRTFGPLVGGEYPTYRLYGTLSPAQRRTLQDKGRFPMMNMTPAQVSLIADMVFNSYEGPTIQDPNENKADSVNMVFAFSSGDGYRIVGPRNAAHERTIVLPNGITRDGFMTGQIRDREAVQCIDSETGDSVVQDANGLALSRAAASSSAMAAFGAPKHYDRFRLATNTEITLDFRLEPGIGMTRTLRDAFADATRPAIAYADLPADFRKKVEAAQKSFAEGFDSEGGGRQIPPPPRSN